MKNKKYIKNKKALSTVVSTVLLILLVLVAVGIVWTSVRAFINNQMEKTKCFDVEASDKVGLNDYYTCYMDLDPEPGDPDGIIDYVQFSIEMGDVEIDALVVSILSAGTTKTYILTNELQSLSGLEAYPYLSDESVILPGKNEALTYVATGITKTIDWIKIAPVVDGNQCGESDQSYEIGPC